MSWKPGDGVEWREVWRGRVLGTLPVEVVVDGDDLLALYLREGTPFGFPEPWPWGVHPWAERGEWQGHGPLILYRPGDAYTVWTFWRGARREFWGWYVNLQAPFRRGERFLETFDHELDIWLDADGTLEVKDADLLGACVREGRFTAAEVGAIRSTADSLLRELERGERWWDDVWSRWQPD